MHLKHHSKEIKGISRLASALASDDLRKVSKEIQLCLKNIQPEKTYETILQSYLFCGFPAVIESLRLFRKFSDGFTKPAENYNIKNFSSRGILNCKKIYSKNFDNLMKNMDALSPDLKQWMIVEGYGKVMGRSGLDLLEREFVNIAILCTRYYENQLYSHIKGCLNNGGKKTEIAKLFKGLKGIASDSNIDKSLTLLEGISS